MKQFLLSLVVIIGIAIPNPSEAQDSWEDLLRAARQPIVTLNSDFVFADLLGEFGNVVDQEAADSWARGWGGNFGISVAPPSARYNNWSRYTRLHIDVGFIIYGTETIRVCLTRPCRIQTDMVTTNSILTLGVGPEFILMTGPIRPYISGTVGTSLFSTNTSLQGIAWDDTDGYFNTNHFQDWTFSWKAGAGVKISMSPSFSIDFGADYLNNGVARWMTTGDIIDNDNRPPTITYRKTEANLFMIRAGIEWSIFGRSR
jgi:opacity protein-like surface antigen